MHRRGGRHPHPADLPAARGDRVRGLCQPRVRDRRRRPAAGDEAVVRLHARRARRAVRRGPRSTTLLTRGGEMSKKTKMRRREFLQVAAAALPAARYARILGANDRVRVGIVGFSDRFRQALLPAFGKVGKELNFEIVAVSDIWNRRRDEGVAGIEKVMGAKPRPFRNNEELYDAKVTDAVMISTPDFLHAHHGVDAIRAGQDAYIEKPLAHTMEKAVEIRDAVKQSNRIVQIGTQRRSAKNYQIANDFIRSGKFGDIVMAEMTWNVNQPGRWRRPELVATIKEQDTDWKRFPAYLPYET